MAKLPAIAVLFVIFSVQFLLSQPDLGTCGSTGTYTSTVPYKPTRTPLPDQYLKILIVYVTFADDESIGFDPNFWPPHQMPVSPNGGIPILNRTEVSPSVLFMDRYPAYTMSDYFCEMSMGQLDVIGDEVLVNLPYPVSYYKNLFPGTDNYGNMNKHVLLNYVDPMPNIDFANYDNWRFNTARQEWEFGSDGIVDMVIMNYRNTFNDGWFFNGGFSGLWDLANSAQTFGIYMDGKFVNSYFDVFGSGVTVALGVPWNYSGMVNAMNHELSHHFFVDNLSVTYHSFVGLMTGFSETSFNMAPDERTNPILGWLNPTIIQPPSTQTITLRDYIASGDVCKIQLPNTNEYFWIANHQKVSLYDGISRGSKECYQINKAWQNPYCDIGKGLFIYHQHYIFCGMHQDCSSPTPNIYNPVELETADGRYNWYKVRDVNYYVPGYSFTIPMFEPVVNGGSPSGLEEYNKVIRLSNACGMQEVNDDPCNMHNDLNDYIVTLDKNGDGRDAFNIGYDEIFSPYSNPNSYTCTGQNTDITINLISQNTNGDITLKIYFNNSQALSDLPPSKPKNLKTVKYIINPTTGLFYPKLTWDANSESDFILGGNYKIYRGVSNTCNIDVEPTYYAVATISSATNEFIDQDVSLYPSGGGSGACQYHFKSYSYKVQAIDNTSKSSLKSDRSIINGYEDPCAPDYSPEYIGNINPTKFSVYNYPNPFNPSTEIKYELPKICL